MTQPSQQARKRYYLVSLDMTLEGFDGYDFTNEGDALVNGRTAGTHEYMVPGFSAPVCRGVPSLRERPELQIGGSGRQALDYYGQRPVFVSDRAKNLIEAIDPKGFEFAECETSTMVGEPIQQYWMMDAIRLLERFDEGRSVFERTRDRFQSAPGMEENPTILSLQDIYFPKEFPNDWHAFWLGYYHSYAVFDEVLVDAWRDSGLKGVVFTPLQMPTDVDLKDRLSFVNYPYWTERVKQP